MMKLPTILLALMLAATAARAEGPLPQPKLGATCPPGYEVSGGYSCRTEHTLPRDAEDRRDLPRRLHGERRQRGRSPCVGLATE
jgi:hypothetical protein